MSKIIPLLISNRKVLTWLIAAALSAVAAIALEPVELLHDALHQAVDARPHRKQ